MRWPRVAIGTAVLATAIRIDTDLEAYIRAFISRNDGAAGVAEELGDRSDLVFAAGFRVRFVVQALEPVRRVLRRAASTMGCFRIAHFFAVVTSYAEPT